MAKLAQWSIKGVDDETRRVARDAAVAAGLAIGAWIDRAILRVAPPVAAASHPEPEQPPQVAPITPVVAPPPEERLQVEPSLRVPREAEPDPVSELSQRPHRSVSAGPPTRKPAAERLAELRARRRAASPDAGEPPLPRGDGLGRNFWIAAAALAVVAAGAYLVLAPETATEPKLAATEPTPAASPASAERQGPAPAPIAATAPAAPETGEGLEAAAVAALQRAALAGDSRAQYDLGVRYAGGRGVPQDPAKAAQWFERAAVQGLVPAQYNLAVMYDRGMGVKQDDLLAFFWYQSAAEQGHPRAQHNLATAFADGRGTAQDYQASAKWFEKAADAGLAESQLYLGMMYERGLGMARDPARALKLFRQAASQGNVEAVAKIKEMGAAAGEAAPAGAVKAASSAEPAQQGSAPSRAQVAEIQRLLARLDFDPGPADGVAGAKTLKAIALYQRFAGAESDGKPSAELLEELRAVAGDVAAGAPRRRRSGS